MKIIQGKGFRGIKSIEKLWTGKIGVKSKCRWRSLFVRFDLHGWVEEFASVGVGGGSFVGHGFYF
ncbi:MAG: hypothetical protein F6K22_09980 [Okeania sp. SIO2F4]|uniref:hypothetical protein n=1 Tax=Okeania sp. SIO2F4 TaxID=2607790 RepID=UPI001429DBD8|nr:hypothetical protein [Okeania sp. SIO2F4]NES03151.1 hypothetical protein [Okeania sp. SIO2F4]